MFENVDIVLSLLLSIVPVILAIAEHFAGKCKPLFLILNAVYFAAACLALIYKGGTLAGLLIVVMIVLAVRLSMEILAGGKNK